MTKDEIIALAREAGANGLRPYSKRSADDPVTAFRLTPDQLVRLADQVAAKERERVAKEFDRRCFLNDGSKCTGWYEVDEPAELIRELGSRATAWNDVPPMQDESFGNRR